MFLKRTVIGTALMTAMNHRKGNQFILGLASLFKNIDREDMYVSMVRGFKPGENYL
jgi:hypothetical protein